MAYFFGGSLYSNSTAMHAAIADEFLSAGGLNSEDFQQETLRTVGAEKLADDAIDGWNLDGLNDEGNRVNPAFDRAELIAAFAKMMKSVV